MPLSPPDVHPCRDGYQHHPDAPHLQAVAHCGKFAAHMRDIILLQLCVSLMLALPGAEGGEAGEGQAGRLGMQNVSESVREVRSQIWSRHTG